MLGIKTRIKKQIEEFIFNRSIYKIPSFFSDVKKVGVSTLIYKSGLKMTIYSLSSLFYSLGMTLPVFAVEDGTVKESDINLLKKHFSITILRNKDATKLIEEKFKFYKAFLRYRLNKKTPFTKYKLDALLFSPFNKTLFLEADTLFFKKPSALDEWFRKKSAQVLFLEHPRAYLAAQERDEPDYTIRVLIDIYYRKLVSPSFNAGLLGIPNRKVINVKLLNEVFQQFERLSYNRSYFAEETSVSIILSGVSKFKLNYQQYFCPATHGEYLQMPPRKNIKFVHYIGESKIFYKKDVVDLIKKTKLFTKL